MATKIVTKNSSTASAVPTASDLVQGELAVNVADKRLFTEDNGGAVVEIGTNPSSLTVSGNIDVDGITNLDVVDIDGAVDMASTLTVTGEITANGGIALGDNDKATFGASDDLQIYHDGSNSYISDTSGTGDLYLRGSNLRLTDNDGTLFLFGSNNADTRLYYNGSQKLATTSTGIDVTGTATMDGLTVASAAPLIEVTDTDTPVTTFIQSTGSQGRIGTSTAHDLFIYAGDTNRARFNDNGDISFYEDTGTTPKLTWDASAESLGIGTSSPSTYGVDGAEDLVIGQADGNHGLTISSFGSSNGTIAFSDQTNVAVGRGYLDYDHSVNAMTVGTNGSERLRIDSSGNVGIGTDSPTRALEVYDATAAHLNIKTGTAGISYLNFGDTDDDNVGRVEYAHSGNSMQFFTAASEVMRIDSSGNVSIGTSTTSAPLRVNVGTDQNCAINTSGGNPRITAHNDAANVSVPLAFNGSILKFEVGGTESTRIDSSGNLLVGTTTSSLLVSGHSLLGGGADNGIARHVASNIEALQLSRLNSAGTLAAFYKDGASVGSISVTASATAYNTSSDQRLKDNIADADDAGSKIDSIQVRKYDWKADGSHQDYGMVAQELLEVAPEAVSVPEDSEEMMGVDYSKLVPMLIKEIQSLRNRVAQLETGE